MAGHEYRNSPAAGADEHRHLGSADPFAVIVDNGYRPLKPAQYQRIRHFDPADPKNKPDLNQS